MRVPRDIEMLAHVVNCATGPTRLLEALHGHASAADASLREVRIGRLKHFDAFLYLLAVTTKDMLGAQNTPPLSFAALRARLQQAETTDPTWRATQLQRKLYLQVAKRVRTHTGTLTASLWYLYHWLRLR